MIRRLLLSLAMLSLLATLAFASDPGVSLDFVQGVARVRLNGSFAGQTYRVYRGVSAAAATPADLLLVDDALCTGDCYVVDRGALQGATYAYTFQLQGSDGRTQSFGPYPVTIGHEVAPGASLAISPNPTRSLARVRIDAARAANDPARRILGVPGEVTLLDVRGRVVRRLWSGTVSALTFEVAFDGRDERGGRLAPGLYFAHFRSADLAATTRLVVAR